MDDLFSKLFYLYLLHVIVDDRCHHIHTDAFFADMIVSQTYGLLE